MCSAADGSPGGVEGSEGTLWVMLEGGRVGCAVQEIGTECGGI